LQSRFDFLPLHKLGAREDKQNPGVINFGLQLPGVSADKGNKLWVRVIHEKDQFLQDILPLNFEMEHSEDSEYGDYWSVTVNIVPQDKPKPHSAWGTPGKYVYRYCLENPDKQNPVDWIIDPFPESLESASCLRLRSDTKITNGASMNWYGRLPQLMILFCMN